jgi:hypothetical protein
MLPSSSRMTRNACGFPPVLERPTEVKGALLSLRYLGRLSGAAGLGVRPPRARPRRECCPACRLRCRGKVKSRPVVPQVQQRLVGKLARRKRHVWTARPEPVMLANSIKRDIRTH